MEAFPTKRTPAQSDILRMFNNLQTIGASVQCVVFHKGDYMSWVLVIPTDEELYSGFNAHQPLADTAKTVALRTRGSLLTPFSAVINHTTANLPDYRDRFGPLL